MTFIVPATDTAQRAALKAYIGTPGRMPNQQPGPLATVLQPGREVHMHQSHICVRVQGAVKPAASITPRSSYSSGRTPRSASQSLTPQSSQTLTPPRGSRVAGKYTISHLVKPQGVQIDITASHCDWHSDTRKMQVSTHRVQQPPVIYGARCPRCAAQTHRAPRPQAPSQPAASQSSAAARQLTGPAPSTPAPEWTAHSPFFL